MIIYISSQYIYEHITLVKLTEPAPLTICQSTQKQNYMQKDEEFIKLWTARWKSFTPEEQQVVVFPALGLIGFPNLGPATTDQKDDTIDQEYRSIDNTIADLSRGHIVDLVCSITKIKQVLNVESITDREIRLFVHKWTRSFAQFDLAVDCEIIYRLGTKKHQKHKQPIKKIKTVRAKIYRLT